MLITALGLLLQPGSAARHAGDDERVLSCLKAILRNFAATDPDAGIAEPDALLAEIAGWLRREFENSERWTRQKGADGLPPRLARFLGPDAARIEMARPVAGRESDRPVGLQRDEEAFVDLGDGFSIVRLVDPSAERREFAVTGIDRNLVRPHRPEIVSTVYSMRDAQGRSIAILQVFDDRMVQVHYSRNDPGDLDRMSTRDALECFLRFSSSWRVIGVERAFGFVVDDGGNWHPISDMPDGLRVSGGIDLSRTGITRMPEDVDAGLRLDVSLTPLSLVPTGLVTEVLDIRGSQIREIPDGAVVRKAINVEEGVLTFVGSGVSDDVVLTRYGEKWGTIGELRGRGYGPSQRRFSVPVLPSFLRQDG